MRPRISIRGFVCWSAGPSVRNAFVLNMRKRANSTSEEEGMSKGGRGRKGGWGAGQGVMRGRDGASTNVPIPPRDASDGRVSGLVVLYHKICRSIFD